MTPTRELWRAVPGHEGSYEVSDQGRVRSLDRVVHDRMGRDRFWPGRVLKLQPLKKNGGRHVVLLREHSGGDLWIVARLVLRAFVGPAPDGMEACHGNGICTDDRLENLRWDTRRENVLDQVRHGVHYEARQSECKWGHPLSGLNARPHRRKNGRICRACAAARAKAQRDAHEGLPAENHKDLADAYYRRFTKEWHEAVLIAHRDTTVALHTIHGWQRFQWGWPRFLLVWAASFQAIAAGVLAFAPYEQVLTQGTRPVLEMASRYVWAALFFASAAATGAAPWMRPGYRALAWVAVMGLGGVWLTAFAVNVANGGGSALGLVSWFFLYVPIVAVALHMGLAKR